jgi:hypothetical protein
VFMQIEANFGVTLGGNPLANTDAAHTYSSGLTAYSGRTWALIPAGLGHRFRAHLGTDSGAPGH